MFGTLVERINDQHRACLGAASMALAHALAAGDLLLEVKKGVKHREWGAWLSGRHRGHDAQGMIGRTKESWRRLEASEPGHRFQDRYRRREDGRGWRDPRRLLYVAGWSSWPAAS